MHSYQSVKSSIDLLLRSASNGLTLNQLNCDYQYYNQSKDIPYANFGYSSLFAFVSDMNDIARIDLNNSSPIVHSVQTKSIRKEKLSLIKISKKPVNKSVKRLALNCLSDTNRQMNISTEHVIRQLTSLTMNPKYSENFSSNEILMISINSNEQCQVVRYTNGKYFIPCFELSRILNLNENILDKETMFSRIRIYQSNELFSRFIHMKTSCLHWRNAHRPYLFLFLISSLIPFLKSSKILLPQRNSIVHTFEQLIID